MHVQETVFRHLCQASDKGLYLIGHYRTALRSDVSAEGNTKGVQCFYFQLLGSAASPALPASQGASGPRAGRQGGGAKAGNRGGTKLQEEVFEVQSS